MTDFKLDILYGYKILEKEFNWISRKTILGWLFKTYKYYVYTPYIKIGPYDSYEEALRFKAMLL